MKKSGIRNSSMELAPRRRFLGSTLGCTLALALALTVPAAMAEAHGKPGDKDRKPVPTVRLPLVAGWYDGQQVLYIQTEASDPDVAKAQNVNYVPRLANAIPADDSAPSAVDDIYVISGFTQANVIPSAPNPAGPNNQDQDYSPLWQVSVVTWAPGATPHLLRSEADIFSARDQGLVAIDKKNIVVNCPVIFTPSGGLLPTAKITIGGHLDDDK